MNAHPSNFSRVPGFGKALRGATLLVAIGSALACTAILKPRDSVQRCGTADDCDPTGDNRYVAECRYGEGQMYDSTEVDQICVAEYRSISCSPMSYTNPEHPYAIALDDCGDLSCAEENRGRLGCPPTDAGVCTEGSNDTFGPNSVPFCGDGDIVPAFALDGDLENQHVKDAFCKSFFCDDSFVCNTSGKCQPCDPSEPYGDGGCGIAYNDGAAAPVYLLDDALEEQCAGEDADVDEPVFGAC